jgi:methylglutaconyl-CoA hydratase
VKDSSDPMPTDLTALAFKELRVARNGPVVQAELHSPQTGNTLTSTALDELLAVLGTIREDPGIRVLVLSGAGEDFCVGFDRTEFEAAMATDPSGAALRVTADKARRVCEALETAGVVTIARLHGRVIGAGLALAVFCDLRVGTDTCRFRMPELALGLPPAWGGALARLMAEVGAARIREIVLTCDTFDAATAHSLSLLHKVVPAWHLDEAVDAWIRPLLRRSGESLAVAKMMLAAHSRAQHLADTTLLDASLLSAAYAAAQPGRAQDQGRAAVPPSPPPW